MADPEVQQLAEQIKKLSPADGFEVAAGLIRNGKPGLALRIAEAAVVKLQEAELSAMMLGRRNEESVERG